MSEYPYNDGDFIVLGPEIFASKDAAVICWKGENYVRQPSLEPAMSGANPNQVSRYLTARISAIRSGKLRPWGDS